MHTKYGWCVWFLKRESTLEKYHGMQANGRTKTINKRSAQMKPSLNLNGLCFALEKMFSLLRVRSIHCVQIVHCRAQWRCETNKQITNWKKNDEKKEVKMALRCCSRIEQHSCNHSKSWKKMLFDLNCEREKKRTNESGKKGIKMYIRTKKAKAKASPPFPHTNKS